MQRNFCVLALVIGACLLFTACNFGPVVDPPSVPVEIRLEATPQAVTAAGNLSLTAKVKYGGAFVGTVETRVVLYDGDLAVGETNVSDPPLSSNLPGDYAFQINVPITRNQNGTRSYTAKAFFDQNRKSLGSEPLLVNVNIP
jgi:hypothetical protein